MPRQYQYTPLISGQIRTVRFHRPENTGCLSFEFRLGSMDELRETYTAISYCWGSAERTAQLYCPSGHFLRITRVVEEIAHWLVNRQDDGFFWIDFLCINQEDLQEKGEQVGMIYKIFSGSALVEAWLGDNVEDGEAALEILQGLSDAFYEQCPVDDTAAYLSSKWRRRMKMRFPQSDIERLRGLLHHDWFKRTWVAQEIITAPVEEGPRGGEMLILYFNGHALPWTTLHNAIGNVLGGVVETFNQMDEEAMASAQYLSYVSMLRDRYQAKEPIHLREALLEFMTLQASDPRDRIYGVMNVCKELEHGSIVPNYTMSVTDVYIQSAYTLIVENGVLDILVAAGIGRVKPNMTLPSWVPDWRLGESMPGGYIMKKYSAYTASGSQVADIRGDWKLRRIILKGVKIDTCEKRLPSPQEYPGTIVTLIGKLSRRWVDAPGKPTRKSISYDGLSSVHDDRVNDIIQLWAEASDVWTEGDKAEPEIDEDNIHAATLMQGLGSLTLENVFGSQQRGLIGLGPERARNGDAICIVLGLDLPCLLRPKQLKDEQIFAWEFVGICFVDGIMYGGEVDMKRIRDFTVV